jgi:hypothetical protein
VLSSLRSAGAEYGKLFDTYFPDFPDTFFHGGF